jgi:dihydroxy-acid dehydratase
VAATGGSTNAVLHLLALAREAGIPLSIDDFDRVSRRTPLLADLKPGGQYVAVDMDRAGGVPLLVQRLLQAGKLDGKPSPGTAAAGPTMRGCAGDARAEGGPPISEPVSQVGGLVILRGNLAPKAAW